MRRSVVAVLAAVLLTAAACGSSASNKTAGSSSSGDSRSSSSGSDSNSLPAADSGAFCKAVQVADIGGIGSDANRAKAEVDKLRSVTPPAAIKDDWNKFLDGLSSLAKINPTNAADVAAWAQRYGAEYGTAAGKVGLYLSSSCLSATSDLQSSLSSGLTDLSDFSTP